MQLLNTSSTSSCIRQPTSAACSAETKGSKALTSMPNALANSATPRAILPKPISPRRLPPSSLPLRLFLSQSPNRRLLSARAINLVDAIRCPIVSSTTLLVDAPGVLQTTIPFLVAESMSMLSTPTPALPMKPNLPTLQDARITSGVILVALRTTTASNSASAPARNSSAE